MDILQTKLREHFLYYCQEGKIGDMCVCLISYNPDFDTLHEGLYKAINMQHGNTVNFLIQQFYIDPHWNNNKYFYEVLRVRNSSRSKNLILKLMKAKKFDKTKINSILLDFLQNDRYIDDTHLFKWEKFPFFKYFPEEIKNSIKNKQNNLKIKIINFLKLHCAIKEF